MRLPTSLKACALLLALTLALSLAPAAQANCPECSDEKRDGFVCNLGRWPGKKGETYGCHKGYCWTKCIGGELTPFFGRLVAGTEWCWTTKGPSQDFQYVRCNNDDDCCQYWHCASSCTI